MVVTRVDGLVFEQPWNLARILRARAAAPDSVTSCQPCPFVPPRLGSHEAAHSGRTNRRISQRRRNEPDTEYPKRPAHARRAGLDADQSETKAPLADAVTAPHWPPLITALHAPTPWQV